MCIYPRRLTCVFLNESVVECIVFQFFFTAYTYKYINIRVTSGDEFDTSLKEMKNSEYFQNSYLRAFMP